MSQSAARDDERRFPLHVWFVPLRDPLDYPNGAVFQFPSLRSPLELARAKSAIPEVFIPLKFMISLKVHQIETAFERVGDRTGHAFQACRIAFPTYFTEAPDKSDRRDANDPTVPVTVIEAAYAEYNTTPSEGFEEAMHPLEAILEKVKQFQLACSMVSGRVVRIETIRTLPATIPLATASVSSNGVEVDGDVTLYMIEDNMVNEFSGRTEFAPTDVGRVAAYIDHLNGVFGGFMTSQFEAQSALQFRVDGRASILASATACEILLDDLLRHLRWESGMRPEDCVSNFVSDGQSISCLRRSRQHLHQLLNGNWNVDSQSSLRAWQHDVAHVRHKVIHAGYEPSTAEAEAALAAVNGLYQFLADLVAKNTHRFPRTAFMFFGGDGLKQRGLFTRRLTAMLDAENIRAWSTRFNRWRDCLERLVEEQVIGSGITAPADLRLAAVFNQPGRYDWVLHDVANRTAAKCRIDESLVHDQVAESLEGLGRVLDESSLPQSVLVEDLYGAEPTEDWVAEHRRLPLVEVMVAGGDFY